MKKQPMSEVVEALKEWAPKGTRVYIVLRNVSRSGLRREIGLVVFDREQGDMRHIDFSTAALLGYPTGKHDGVVVNGCGMDMGFALVSALSAKLYGDDLALRHSWL